MDYVSVPQVHKANQGLAIASISGYVGICDLFILTLALTLTLTLTL